MTELTPEMLANAMKSIAERGNEPTTIYCSSDQQVIETERAGFRAVRVLTEKDLRS